MSDDYVLQGSPEQMGDALDRIGDALERIAEAAEKLAGLPCADPPKRAIGIQGIMEAINALPEPDRSSVLAQLRLNGR